MRKINDGEPSNRKGLWAMTNKQGGWALLKCIRLSAHYRFIKFVLDVATFIVVTVSEIEFAHELMEGEPIIEVWH